MERRKTFTFSITCLEVYQLNSEKTTTYYHLGNTGVNFLNERTTGVLSLKLKSEFYLLHVNNTP